MNDLRKTENFHVALWLLKDCAWCAGWKWLGMVMVLPTLVMAGKIAWASRKVPSDLVHNIVVCIWICANVTWMMGEFFYDDRTRPFAILLFCVGLICLCAFYFKEGARLLFDSHHR